MPRRVGVTNAVIRTCVHHQFKHFRRFLLYNPVLFVLDINNRGERCFSEYINDMWCELHLRRAPEGIIKCPLELSVLFLCSRKRVDIKMFCGINSSRGMSEKNRQ